MDSVDTATQSALSSSARESELSCLVIIRVAIKSRHFVNEPVVRITSAIRPSTLEIYEGKWRAFER